MNSKDEVEAVNYLKTLLTAVSNDEIVNLQAELVKKLYDAYMSKGFTSDQAVTFVCAALSNSKSQ